MNKIEILLVKQIEELAKRAGEIHLNASKHALNDLLNEIESENYTTIAQVKGAIYSSLEMLNNLGEIK